MSTGEVTAPRYQLPVIGKVACPLECTCSVFLPPQRGAERARPTRMAALCRNIAASHWSMLKGRCSRQAQSELSDKAV